MVEIIIPVLTFLSVIAIGSSVLLARKQKLMTMSVRLQDSRLAEMPGKPVSQKFDFLRLLAEIGNFVSHGNSSRTLTEQLIRAGYIGSAAPAVYTGVKILLFIVGLVAMTLVLIPLELVATSKLILIVIAATILFSNQSKRMVDFCLRIRSTCTNCLGPMPAALWA